MANMARPLAERLDARQRAQLAGIADGAIGEIGRLGLTRTLPRELAAGINAGDPAARLAARLRYAQAAGKNYARGMAMPVDGRRTLMVDADADPACPCVVALGIQAVLEQALREDQDGPTPCRVRISANGRPADALLARLRQLLGMYGEAFEATVTVDWAEVEMRG